MSPLDRHRLTWKCRRGLLELDLVLQKFIPSVRDEELPRLLALLELPDNDLWDIIIGRSEHYDSDLRQTVARLRAV